MEKILKAFSDRPPKFFTFNDGFALDQPVKTAEFLFGEFLRSYFPYPSQYELPDVPF